MEPTLNAIEVRVLSSLIEKQITTPEYYPLSLNALVNACNQKSNREPVVNYGEEAVEKALDSLRAKQLSRVIMEGSGRVPKYAHVFNQALRLTRPQVAVLCVLMLRGAQTIGEIRGRTGRIHEFKDLEEVEEVIRELQEREECPLVCKLARQTGFKEPRYAHLLAGTPPAEADAPMGASGIAPDAHPDGKEERLAGLEEEVRTLRQELADLRRQFNEFRKQFE